MSILGYTHIATDDHKGVPSVLPEGKNIQKFCKNNIGDGSNISRVWHFWHFWEIWRVFALNFNFSRQIKSLFIFSVLTSFFLNFNFSFSRQINSLFIFRGLTSFFPQFQSFRSNQLFVYFQRFDEFFRCFIKSFKKYFQLKNLRNILPNVSKVWNKCFLDAWNLYVVYSTKGALSRTHSTKSTVLFKIKIVEKTSGSDGIEAQFFSFTA